MVIPVFGTVEIIAHFKIGIEDWIHIALVSKNIQVNRKASMFILVNFYNEINEFPIVCGDKYCDVKYENCSTCPIDCGKCPLKPIHIGLITTGCTIFIGSFIGVFLVSGNYSKKCSSAFVYLVF